jgi:hypothetical protein
MKLFTFFFFLLTTFVSQVFAQQKDHFIIGQGGGITGKIVQYQICRNGKVLKGSGLAEIVYTAESKIKKSQAEKFFKKMKNLSDEPFRHPGNMYYYISFFRNNTEIRYTWGSKDFDPPAEISCIYKEIFQKISELDFKQMQ